jgi:hypothetical protein
VAHELILLYVAVFRVFGRKSRKPPVIKEPFVLPRSALSSAASASASTSIRSGGGGSGKLKPMQQMPTIFSVPSLTGLDRMSVSPADAATHLPPSIAEQPSLAAGIPSSSDHTHVQQTDGTTIPKPGAAKEPASSVTSTPQSTSAADTDTAARGFFSHGSVKASIFNLCSSSLGAGALALPYAFEQCGMCVFSSSRMT